MPKQRDLTRATSTEVRINKCVISESPEIQSTCRNDDKCKTGTLEVVTAFKKGQLPFKFQDFGAGWGVLTENLKNNATRAFRQLSTGIIPLNYRDFLIIPN